MLRRVSASFIAQLWYLVLSLADRILLVGILLRAWGPVVYADWVTIAATAGLISIGEMGLQIYFGNKWQQAFALDNEEDFQRIVGISISVYLFVTTTLATIVLVYINVSNFTVGSVSELLNSYHAIFVFIILSVMQLLKVFRGSVSQIYRGRGKYAAGIIVNSSVTFTTLVCVSIAALLGSGPLLVAGLYLLCDLIFGWGLMLFDLRRRFSDLRFVAVLPTHYELREICRHGKWYGLLQGAPIAWLQVPVLVISSLGLGAALLVSFTLARTLVNFAHQISDMLARSVGVEMATEFHLGDVNRLSRTLYSFGNFLSSITGAIVGGLVFFGSLVIGLWSGDQSLFNSWIFCWLLAPSVFVTPATPLRNILEFANKPRPVGQARLLQVIVGMVLCYILAQPFGVSGAAAGLAIGEALALGLFLPFVGYHNIGERYVRYFFGCVLRFVAAGGWSASVAWSIIHFFEPVSLVMFLLCCLFWTAVGFLPVLVLSVPHHKRIEIMNKWLFRLHFKS